MRIISGQFGGLRLHPPAVKSVRPTTDRAREALFNVLAAQVDWPDAHVLDVFAGFGGLSLEALSRGAQHVLSVERNHKVARFLESQRLALKLEARWEILALPFDRMWQHLASYELIMLDPPYALPNKEELVVRLLAQHLTPGGLLVLEHPTQERFQHIRGFSQERSYGQSAFSFFSAAS